MSDPEQQDPSSHHDPHALAVNEHIRWFRQASPYINKHRGKTIVLCFDGSMLASAQFPTLVHDITLLRNLGIRLVLVHGIREQLNQQLEHKGIVSQFENGLRITTDSILDELLHCVGKARIAIESRLSMGLPNTPMSGSHISVSSGNFVTAQPYGVVDGIDHCHTGVVRQIHANTIRRQIDADQLVLLSPIGYSRTGELFNLQCEEVATQAAIQLDADKLIFLSSTIIRNANGDQIRQSTPLDIQARLSSLAIDVEGRSIVKRAIEACQRGVQRVHIINQSDSDALLNDLFTRDGSGTMINADVYERIRTAAIHDVGGIIALITPLEEDGTLVKRSREQLELDIEKFMVAERDGTIIACAALIIDAEDSSVGEIACVVTHPDYRNGKRAEKLLRELEARATTLSLRSIYVLTTRSNHWFIEQGFKPASAHELPPLRQDRINQQRNSKVLVKMLS